MTAPASVYPLSLEDLLPRARELAADLGGVPARNLLMRELRIGTNKATQLVTVLRMEADAAASFTGQAQKVLLPDPDPADGPAADVDGPAPSDPAPDDTPPPVSALAAVDGHPGTTITDHPAPAPADRPVKARPAVRSWPLFLIALPAAVAIWAGWVGLGGLTGFGVVAPFPGIWDTFTINTAITLPIGVEAYAAYALKAWLSGNRVPLVARRFAKWSAIGSLLVGSAGQVAYHLMEAAHMTAAPAVITTAVSCLPVAVLGMGAALAHLLHRTDEEAN